MTSKKHQTTPEIRAKIKELRNAGWTCKAVSNALGVSETTVKNYTGFYKRNESLYIAEPVPVVKVKPPREALVEIVRRYKERQFSLTQIGSLTHLPYREIVDLLGDGNGRVDTLSN